jgi:hypothetical protein
VKLVEQLLIQLRTNRLLQLFSRAMIETCV